MNTIDNYKQLLQLHELLNRLIVPVTHEDFNRLQPKIAEIRANIAKLQAEQTATEPYKPVNYEQVIELSVIGRVKIAVYPYPKNAFDNISKHNKNVRRAKFNRAWKTVKMRQIQSLVLHMA